MWFRRYNYISYIVDGKEQVFEQLERDVDEIFKNDYPELENIQKVVEDVNNYYYSMAIIRARIDYEPDRIKLNYERDIAFVSDAFKSCEVA